jgi:hypothetical protein
VASVGLQVTQVKHEATGDLVRMTRFENRRFSATVAPDCLPVPLLSLASFYAICIVYASYGSGPGKSLICRC